jgi:hypothetical protein
MAKRNSMSTARRSRNRKQDTVIQRGATTAGLPSDRPTPEPISRSDPANLAESVSNARVRLIHAQAVLACIAFAMLYEDWLEGPNRPSFEDAVTVVQDLVNDAIQRLCFEVSYASKG